MRSFSIADAAISDIDRLVRLEEASFRTDRISRQSFRRLVRSKSAICRIATAGGALAGYSVVLTRTGTTSARLYSIAVDRAWQGVGLAAMLMGDAERTARRRGMTRLRLEVREDNAAAIRLYEKLGFRQTGRRPGYYADGATAVRYEKRLPGGRMARPAPTPRRLKQPAG